eukprot:1196025-Prorocentrum_minimum.AAC.2
MFSWIVSGGCKRHRTVYKRWWVRQDNTTCIHPPSPGAALSPPGWGGSYNGEGVRCSVANDLKAVPDVCDDDKRHPGDLPGRGKLLFSYTVPVQNDELLKELGVSARKEKPAAGPSMDVGQTRSYYNCAIQQFRKIQRKRPGPRTGVG